MAINNMVDSPSLKQLYAPWTPEIVKDLNKQQHAEFLHPYTCGNRSDASHPDDAILIATVLGWQCDYCDYQQNWCHDPKPFLFFHVRFEEIEDKLKVSYDT